MRRRLARGVANESPRGVTRLVSTSSGLRRFRSDARLLQKPASSVHGEKRSEYDLGFPGMASAKPRLALPVDRLRLVAGSDGATEHAGEDEDPDGKRGPDRDVPEAADAADSADAAGGDAAHGVHAERKDGCPAPRGVAAPRRAQLGGE